MRDRTDAGEVANGAPEVEFEAAMERLEEIVARLEQGDLKLAEALALYEEGVCLARAAQGQLEGAEGRIEALLADGTVHEVGPDEAPAAGA